MACRAFGDQLAPSSEGIIKSNDATGESPASSSPSSSPLALFLSETKRLNPLALCDRSPQVWRNIGASPPAFTGLPAVSAMSDSMNGVSSLRAAAAPSLSANKCFIGLLSFIPIVCYAGLIVSIIAAVHKKRHPEKLGWGRIITGFVVSVPMSILYTLVFLAR